jgi:hypothetical protein
MELSDLIYLAYLGIKRYTVALAIELFANLILGCKQLLEEE